MHGRSIRTKRYRLIELRRFPNEKKAVPDRSLYELYAFIPN